MSQARDEIPGNEHALERLQEVFASGKAVAFVGAGASAGLYPLWNQLIRRLADEAVKRGMANDADRDHWLERCATRPQQAVRGIKQALGEGTYFGLLRELFGPKVGAAGERFTLVHEALLKLPFRGYVTTNYDPGLLEARQRLRPDATAAGLGTWRDEALVHRWITGEIFAEDACPVMFLHGSHERPESIVLGAGEYRQAYQQGPFRELLNKLWNQERLVFVGFGFSDSWMSFVADELLTRTGARTSEGPRHIAVIGLHEDEQYTPQLRRDEQDAYNACLLTYPVRSTQEGGQDHSELVELLESAGEAVEAPKNQPRAATASSKPAFPVAYRNWLERHCADIDLVGLRLKESRAVKLNHVYVPLTTPARHDQRPAKSLQLGESSEREPKSELLLGRLNNESLYVSGPPGSGKSTFCRWVTWLTFTGAMPEHGDEEDLEDLREQFPESLRGRLPLLIHLRDFWNYLPDDSGQELSLAQLEQSLDRWLDDKKPGNLTWSSVVPYIRAGTGLMVFDGVDEVPISQGKGAGTWYPRSMLLSALVEAVAEWTPAGNRLLVTSRPYGLNEVERQKLGLPEAPIDHLPRPLQRLLAARWFRILNEDDAEGESLADEMLADIGQRKGISQLILSPMLLTAMCVIYREGKRLPQDKCDLYDRIVDNVLYNRVRDPAQIEMVRNELRVVAHGMHTGTATGQQRNTPAAEVDWQEIDGVLESYRQQSRWTQQGFTDVVTSREFLLSHTGLLLPRPGKQAAFLHLSIQEFLAAERLADASTGELAALFQERADVTEWHNTLSFVFGTLQNTSVDRSVRLVEQLLDNVGSEQLGLQVVIGDALQNLLAKDIRLQPEREEAFRQLCLSAIEREVLLRERNLLGLALGYLGDPRVIANLRELSAYVEIPAGKYAYQKAKQNIDAPFLLSKYPVTNSQFEVFMAEGGYNERNYWTDEGWQWKQGGGLTEPEYWRDPECNAPNQPVVGVSFYEAEAFCKWAGGFLPTEQQWEAAARGKRGFEYPWGKTWEDAICNTDEAGLGVASPVGLFPRSRSLGFDLEDVSGNAWEWCNSWYDSNEIGRVLRGGSFIVSADYARASIRNDDQPDGRNVSVGFRVARTYD